MTSHKIEYIKNTFFKTIEPKIEEVINCQIKFDTINRINLCIEQYFSELPFICKYSHSANKYNEFVTDIVIDIYEQNDIVLSFKIMINDKDVSYISSYNRDISNVGVKPIRIPDINQLDVTFKILSESEIKKFVRDIVITLMYNKYDASLIFDKAISACLNIDNQEDVPQRVKEEISNKLSDESMYVFISSVFMFTETWNAGPLVVENFETESVQKIEQAFKKRLSEFIKNGEILFNVSSYFDGTNLIISDITVTENPQKNNQHIYSYRVTVGKEPHNFSFKKSN